MKLTKTSIIAGTSNIYFQCPSCQTKALVDVDNEVRRLLDIDYQDRFVCEECGEEFLGEVGYDLKPKFTKIADNVESATNTCGIAARPDQLKKLEDEVVSAATPPYRKREIVKSLQDKLINRCAKWFRDDFGHMDDSELTEFLPELGYNDINDMFVVEVTLEDDGRIRAEVRAELSYDGLYDLGEACNPIVQKYDKEAYFDMDQPGIMSAYLDLDGVYGSAKPIESAKVAAGFDEWLYQKGVQPYAELDDDEYSVYYDQYISEQKREDDITGARDYGGAYDIDPESYFTREDLDELGYSVAELVSLDIGDTVEYAGAWIEPNNELTVDLESSDYDSSVTLKVDMRKIRRPEYLIARYAERIADESAAQIREAMNTEERIESSTAINAGYWDEPEDDWIEVDDVTDVVEVDIDGTQITVTADGKYDWTEQEHDWAKDNEIDIPELGTWIALDEYRVEDDVWEMISDMLPEPQSEDRTYTVDGTIRLCYTVSGMLARADGSVREPDDDFGWGYQTMADAVDIEFNYEKSDVVSFHVE